MLDIPQAMMKVQAMNMSEFSLIADIGGTNSRFAFCEKGKVELQHAQTFANKEFGSLREVIEHYIGRAGFGSPSRACIAVACPVTTDRVKLTNCSWEFSQKQLKEQLGLKELYVVNDFTGLAMALPYLPDEDIEQIGTGTAVQRKPIGVLGPGTGLGVSGLIWCGTKWTPLEGEGGHVSFAPCNDLEIELLKHSWKLYNGFVSAERYLCGTGLSFIYRSLIEIEGWEGADHLPEIEITRKTVEENDPRCRKAVDIFCGMLGNVAGNLALTLGAFGGIYIGGGIVPKLGPLFAETPFRSRFEERGRFSDYVKTIPTFKIASHMRATLYGTAAVLAAKGHDE